MAGDLGFSELTIAALLGHAARGVTQGYVHIDEALKLAATRTCEEIASLLSADLKDEAAHKGSRVTVLFSLGAQRSEKSQ